MRRTWAAGSVVLAVALAACAPGSTGTSTPSGSAVASSSAAAGPTSPVAEAVVRRRVLLGYSVEHRPIVAVQLGDPDSGRCVVVVGSIHGNETAGVPLVQALAAGPPPEETDLWLVPDLNPDGSASATRQNAHGVDLNRNFPYQWQPIGAPGALHYAGPVAASEPETRIAVSLLRRVHPTLGLWYHQALTVVDVSQGPARLERRYADDSGLPLRALTDYPGSAVGYEDHLFGPTAFVVELPAGALTPAQLARHRHAVLDVAALAPGGP